MVSESGGAAVRFDGNPYGPADGIDSGIITAVTDDVLSEVRSVLEAVRLPLLARR